ncbi:MAG: hypothetical protein ACHQUC_00295 [Chlamydiales bacterium]
MDFTREPIIETIITPKEGCKLVVRSSKNAGQEEYFVDAVEVVAFGQAFFFRSLERPKPFLVPIVDYEVLEVREARMVLKNVGIDRSIKIGGGRETFPRSVKSPEREAPAVVEPAYKPEVPVAASEEPAEVRLPGRPGLEKKRDRRRQYRKRRGVQTIEKEEEAISAGSAAGMLMEEQAEYHVQEEPTEAPQTGGGMFTSLLQPPPRLISETINLYRENAMFKSAFFLTEEEQYKPHDKVQELLNEEEEEFVPPLQEPEYAEGREALGEEPSEGLVEQVEPSPIPLEKDVEEQLLSPSMESPMVEQAALSLFEEEDDEKFGAEEKNED